MMHTGLRIWGGKFDAFRVISKYFPKKSSRLVFIDLLAGSGVVSLNYWPHNCLLNDKNGLIYSYFYVLGGAKFRELMQNYPNGDNYPLWEYRAMLFDEYETEMESTITGRQWMEDVRDRQDLVGKAIRCTLMAVTNFNGNMFDGKFDWNIPRRIKFAYYQDFIKFVRECDVRVWNLDFREVLRRAKRWHSNPSFQYFIYADPPYLHQGKELYELCFEEQDTRDLRSGLDKTSIDWVVSEKDSEDIRSIFDGCYFQNVEWAEQKEVLISNKPFTERAVKSGSFADWKSF